MQDEMDYSLIAYEDAFFGAKIQFVLVRLEMGLASTIKNAQEVVIGLEIKKTLKGGLIV